MGAVDKGAKQGGFGCPALRPDLLGGGTVCHAVRVGYVSHDPPHWEGVGRIPTQGGPQDDWEATSARKGRHMGITPSGGRDGVAQMVMTCSILPQNNGYLPLLFFIGNKLIVPMDNIDSLFYMYINWFT